jgi:hypothetical protein
MSSSRSKRTTKNKKQNKNNEIVSSKNFYADAKRVTFLPTKFICPFPLRYRTKLRTAFQGNIVAGTVFTSSYWAQANTMKTPFAGGNWPGVIVANITTLNPAGFSNLCSATGPYRGFRVLSASMQLRLIPTNVTDVITFVLGVPNGNLFTTVSDGLAEPRTSSSIAQAGATLRSITKHADVADYFGVPKQSVLDDPTGIFSGQYNTNPTRGMFFNVAWTTQTGAVPLGPISYEVEMVQEVEFWDLLTGDLLDN